LNPNPIRPFQKALEDDDDEFPNKIKQEEILEIFLLNGR